MRWELLERSAATADRPRRAARRLPRLVPWLLALAGCAAPPLPPAPTAGALAASAAPPAASAASPAASERPPGCALDPAPRVIQIDNPRPGELHEVHDLPDTPALWAPAPPTPARALYRERAAARVGSLAPRDLLERQRAVFAAMATPDAQGEVTNLNALLEGRAGVIGPATCVEAALWARQDARFPMLEHPTEFGAHILRGHGRVRIYFSGSDLVGQRMRGEVSERVLDDVRHGFALVAHLHNHPFLLDRTPGDRMWTIEATRSDVAGALAPSINDVHFYRSFRESAGLQGAWVTNGLDTARFGAADFDALAAADPPASGGTKPSSP